MPWPACRAWLGKACAVRSRGAGSHGRVIEAISQREPFAVIDLGTTHAKAIIIQFGPARAWNVVGAAAVRYSHQHSKESPLQAASEALSQAEDRSVLLCGRRVSPAVCAVSIPAGQVGLLTRRYQLTRPNPDQQIGVEEACTILTQAGAATLENPAHQTPHGGSQPGRTWLATVWAACFVDRKSVTSLEGFQGKTVAVELVQALTDQCSVKPVRSWASAHELPAVLLPEQLAAATVIRRLPTCTLVDAGGMRTNIYSASTDRLFRHMSVPLGGHHFTRWLSLVLGLSPSRTESIKLAYSSGRLRPRSADRIAHALRRIMQSWATALCRTVNATQEQLPGSWYTVGGLSLLPEFAHLPVLVANASMSRLLRYPVLEQLCLTQCFAPVFLGPECLSPIHFTATALAAYLVRLASNGRFQAGIRQTAALAKRAGFEVASEWLT